MEARDDYDASYELDSFQRYLAGDPDDLPWLRGWLDLVEKAAAHGKRFTRVRVATVPLSDYSRFGVWCARLMNEAGEDIRYVRRGAAAVEGFPMHDYWLFDSSMLVRMHFDDTNRFIGGEVVKDPTEIVQHCYWRDALWHHAVGRDEFAAEQGI